MSTVLEEARALQEEIVTDRRWLHAHPEIGFELPETTGYVADRLRDMGIEAEEIVQGGLVATIGDPAAGRCFLLRADMDALPLAEEVDLPFAATNGNMHACGHDAHAAMLLGAARILKAHESELNGCVKLMFQPDEEGTAPSEVCGNEAMINAGVLENPSVDAAAAIHLLPLDLARGEVATRPGTSFSSVDDIEIVVHGEGGHGSQPHQAIDPFNVACHIYFGLQNLVARELDPVDQAVVTLGSITGGSAANIIPSDVRMFGTLRTTSEATRARFKERIASMCHDLAAAFGATVDAQLLRGVPSVYNNPELTRELSSYVADLTGDEVTFLDEPKPNSDDMSVISQAVPTTYFLLGTGTREEGVVFPVHNPLSVFDESVFAQGTAILATTALRWLNARADQSFVQESSETLRDDADKKGETNG